MGAQGPDKKRRDPRQFRAARRASLVIFILLALLMVGAMVLATINIRNNPELGFGPWDSVVEMGKLFGIPVAVMLASTVFFAVMERKSK